ncbi:IS110 family transposase, partial [Streptomyces sp. NPDC002589]|uniref:IS110 family transposase n=1 Tax=Streptomyces sp. NPDC002589 TaxID=3154420 RepID=UPI0033209BF7
GQRAVVGHPGPQPRPDHLGVGFRHQRAEAYDDPARPSVGPTRLHGGMHPTAAPAVQHTPQTTGGDHHPELRPALSAEHRMTIRAPRSTARRIRHLQAEARELENELLQLVRQQAPELLELLGVGAITAAQILVSWSHPGRFRSEAAFASFAGVAPIPAPSGPTNKHRLNRGGDRQLNRAMHTITLIRMRLDPATKAYVARRIGEGKSPRDPQRCLKRNICRQISKILERRSQQDAEELPQAT